MLRELYDQASAHVDGLQEASTSEKRAKIAKDAFEALVQLMRACGQVIEADKEWRRRAAEEGATSEAALRRIAQSIGFTDEMREDHEWYSEHHESVEATVLALEQALSADGGLAGDQWN